MMRNIITLALALVSAIMMLAACDTGPQPPAIVPTPTLPVQVTPSPDMKIVYLYTGGIAGARKELVIGPTGEATLTDRGTLLGTFHMGIDAVTELVRKFEAARFFDLQDKYEKADTVVADDIYTTITYTQGGRTKTVTAAQVGGEGITPQSFLDLAAHLNGLVSSFEVKGAPKP
ncbi:MAG TPA: hypothetical protein VEW94_04475 [Chloroflexia bacterium]|nr:hypothetical protein [Chloroflexia bacterium]